MRAGGHDIDYNKLTWKFKCQQCGKRVETPVKRDDWQWKIGSTHCMHPQFYCTYTCMRKAERESEQKTLTTVWHRRFDKLYRYETMLKNGMKQVDALKAMGYNQTTGIDYLRDVCTGRADYEQYKRERMLREAGRSEHGCT